MDTTYVSLASLYQIYSADVDGNRSVQTTEDTASRK